MILVTVHLVSARTGRVRELGRVGITNDDTGNASLRNYDATAYRRGTFSPIRRGRVEHHASRSKPIWALVEKALRSMGYGDS